MKPVIFVSEKTQRMALRDLSLAQLRFRELKTRHMMKKQHFSSVWDAIESDPSEAANMKARAEAMNAIRETVSGWKVTQAVAAKRLGLTQPRMNDLLRGRINKFSLDMLVNVATRAGLTIRIELVRRAA